MMILKASIDAGRRVLRNEVEYGDLMKEGCDCPGLLKSGRLEVEVPVAGRRDDEINIRSLGLEMPQ